MASTIGYVGTIEVETEGTSRIWFSLTDKATSDDWVKIGKHRAWFTMNLDKDNRPLYLAELPLLLDSMRHGLEIKVRHGGALTKAWRSTKGDTYPCEGVRILRAPMHF